MAKTADFEMEAGKVLPAPGSDVRREGGTGYAPLTSSRLRVHLPSTRHVRRFEVLYREEAEELAKRWWALREERLDWLQSRLNLKPAEASLTELWRAALAWHLAGHSSGEATGPCPVWWNDEYDLDDSHVMADALSHSFSDEFLRREPEARIELVSKPGYTNQNQLAIRLGRWSRTPWAGPLACMDALRREAKPRDWFRSAKPDFLETELQGMIRGLDPWKQELDAKRQSDTNIADPETGADLLAMIDAGEDCWSVEPQDEDDEHNFDLIVSFSDPFAHGASAVIDTVTHALIAARPTGAGPIYREDREFILIEAADAGAYPDAAAIKQITDRILRADLPDFGPLR